MSRIATTDLYTTTTAREQVGYLAQAHEATVVRHTTPTGHHRAFVSYSDDCYAAVCYRCGGSGEIVSGVDSNRCWNCHTAGVKGTNMTRADMERRTRTWALGHRRTAAKRAAEARLAELDREIWRGAHAELIEWAESLTPVETHAASTYEPEWYEFGLYGGADEHVNRLLRGARLDDREAKFLDGVRERHLADAAAALVSRHAGEVGDKATITGTVKTARPVEQHFGYRTSYSNFVVIAGTGDDEGITWTMFTTAAAFWALETGDAVTVTATIKELGEYKGAAQDKVTRPKLITT